MYELLFDKKPISKNDVMQNIGMMNSNSLITNIRQIEFE